MGEEDWITARVDEAANGLPLLTDAAIDRTHQLLKGELVNRQLTTAELKAAATQLLDDMKFKAKLSPDGDKANGS